MPDKDFQVGGNHYKSDPIEHWTYVMENNIPYMEAQIIRYVVRWRKKNGMQDLEKAKHYLEKLIEFESGKVKQSPISMADTEDNTLELRGVPGTSQRPTFPPDGVYKG